VGADGSPAAALDTRRALFVISGTQGAGKTPVAALLARRFARGVHVGADELQKMIVSGREWPDADALEPGTHNVTGEAGRRLRLRLHNMCLLGRSFSDAEFTVVIEDVIIGWRVDELLDELRAVEFFFVMLTPGAEAVRARERGRGTRLFEEWKWMHDTIAHATPRIGLWLDSSVQTPEETVDAIMRRAWTEGAVAAGARAVS